MSGERSLTHLVQAVRKMYPAEQATDITASFYFICLLHLANEKGLSIEGQADLSDLFIRPCMQ